jgi:hypothetical protein
MRDRWTRERENSNKNNNNNREKNVPLCTLRPLTKRKMAIDLSTIHSCMSGTLALCGSSSSNSN